MPYCLPPFMGTQFHPNGVLTEAFEKSTVSDEPFAVVAIAENFGRARRGVVDVVDFVALWARFVVGFVFLLAGMTKLSTPDRFAEAIRGYDMLPPRFVDPVAQLLPRLEVSAGLALLIGFAVRLVAGSIVLALIVFETAIIYSLARGREIDCGCIGTAYRRITWSTVLRNAVLLLLAASILWTAPVAMSLDARLGVASVQPQVVSDALPIAVLGLVSVMGALLFSETLKLVRAVSSAEKLLGEPS